MSAQHTTATTKETRQHRSLDPHTRHAHLLGLQVPQVDMVVLAAAGHVVLLLVGAVCHKGRLRRARRACQARTCVSD